jgi:hypothetical protein
MITPFQKIPELAYVLKLRINECTPDERRYKRAFSKNIRERHKEGNEDYLREYHREYTRNYYHDKLSEQLKIDRMLTKMAVMKEKLEAKGYS